MNFRLYNYIVLQQMTDGFLKATGAKVLHFSVDTVQVLDQLKRVEQQLSDLRESTFNHEIFTT